MNICTICHTETFNAAHCIPARDHDKPQIICEGLMYRAINKADGFVSKLHPAAASAGLAIQRRYGKPALKSAFKDFIRARNAVAA